MRNANHAGTVTRVTTLLRFIGDIGHDVPLSHVAAAVDLPLSTVHRMLGQLCDEGFVRFDETTRTYGVGRSLHRIASRIVVSNSLFSLAREFLEELVQEFDETVLLFLYLEAEGAGSFEVRVDGSKDLQYRLSMNTPLTLVHGASGKSILAHLEPAVREQIIEREAAELERVGKHLDPDELEKVLSEVRRTGYCMTENERLHHARGIAAPVFDQSGVLGSIILTSQISTLTDDIVPAVVRSVKRQAEELSRALGGARPIERSGE